MVGQSAPLTGNHATAHTNIHANRHPHNHQNVVSNGGVPHVAYQAIQAGASGVVDNVGAAGGSNPQGGDVNLLDMDAMLGLTLSLPVEAIFSMLGALLIGTSPCLCTCMGTSSTA